MNTVFHNCGRVCKALIVLVIKGLVWLLPRDRNLVVFGAWDGKFFTDNPKYLMLHLLRNSNLRLVWVGCPHIEGLLPKSPRLHFSVWGSWRSRWHLLRAGTWVCCQTQETDLTPWVLYPGALRIDLWHGIPIKGMGCLAAAACKKRSRCMDFYARMIGAPTAWTVISNARMGEIYEKSFPLMFERRKMLPCGLPRNDFLINNSGNQPLIKELKAKYARLLGFDEHQRIVLYLPTYRMKAPEVYSFYNLPDGDQRQWKKMLEANGAVLIEKHHERTMLDAPPPKEAVASITVMPDLRYSIDVQELLLITDLLICDYSSAYIDYALTGRPCVHFAPDFEAYQKDSGLVYKYEDVVAGDVVYDAKKLLPAVENQLKSPSAFRGSRFGELVEYETGMACKSLQQFIMSRGGV